MTPYTLTFTLPGLPPTLNSRGHWRKRHRLNLLWQSMVAKAVAGQHPRKPLKKARLTLTRVSWRSMDRDNLVSGFKSIIDGMVNVGILEDDRWENIGMPEYHWEQGPRGKGQGMVRVQVEGIE